MNVSQSCAERTLPSPQPSRLVPHLPTTEGSKAELAWVAWLNTKMVYLRTVTHLSTNLARCRVTSLMRSTMLPLYRYQATALSAR